MKKLILPPARGRHGIAPAINPPSSPPDPTADPEAWDPAVGLRNDGGVQQEGVSRSGIVLSEPKIPDLRMNDTFTAADCPCCYRPLIVSWKDARPASDVLQDAFGCDPADLYRFFEPDEWLQRWELPLQMTWGTTADWHAIAGIWRATRARREGGFLSLSDISRVSNRPGQ